MSAYLLIFLFATCKYISEYFLLVLKINWARPFLGFRGGTGGLGDVSPTPVKKCK